MTTQANVYPNDKINTTLTHSDSSRDNLAVCFSGGGSRALTCAWGQLIGLTRLNLIDKVRYLSSVSGGTWASSIYTFLPNHISDDQLLGSYTTPQNLSLLDGDGKFNVNNLGEYALGQVPNGFSLTELALTVFLFLHFEQTPDHKWLWASIVAENVLEPFGLRAEGENTWRSSHSYSLSEQYAKANFPTTSPSLDNFFFTKSGRPFIVMNDNIMQAVPTTLHDTSIVQLPNQATPVSTGSKGQTPDGKINGSGTVESYGFTSTLEQASSQASPVNIEISQPYSLIDTVSTSSAFFAETVLSILKNELSSEARKGELIEKIREQLKEEDIHKLLSWAELEKLGLTAIDDIIESYGLHLAGDALSDIGSIVPSYNYWPISSQSSNQTLPFTDGGTLDNTGIIGILSQTEAPTGPASAIKLLAFDNTSEPLEKKNNTIIAGSQAAPLFGIYYMEDSNSYRPFTDAERTPSDPAFIATSLIQVFDNTPDAKGDTPFSLLQKGLYSSNYSDSADQPLNPAQVQLALTTVANPLANISAGRKVTLLYVQNSQMDNWQNQIGDTTLKSEIEKGQQASGIEDELEPFAHFPYYSTFYKIGLSPKESNALSQMWAWATSDEKSPLSTLIQTFISSKK